jgi:hypothetical protein
MSRTIRDDPAEFVDRRARTVGGAADAAPPRIRQTRFRSPAEVLPCWPR